MPTCTHTRSWTHSLKCLALLMKVSSLHAWGNDKKLNPAQLPMHPCVQVKGTGRFLAFCSLRPAAVLFDGQPIEFLHGQSRTGVPFLEVALPIGYSGEPRRLVVQWNSESRVGGVSWAGLDIHSAGR